MKKIKTQKEIVRLARILKRKKKKIVTYSGSFDILHLGHIKSLAEAKGQGDVLIVLLNSDKSVRAYKGPLRPIIPQKERAETLAAFECVDYIIIFNELTPKKILSEIKPQVHCNGPDWGKNCVERAVIEENGGKVYVLRKVGGQSTSGLIANILKGYSRSDIKAVFLDRDGTINNYEPPYISKIKDFKFLPGALSALQKLSKTDYKIFIITNQSGIGRGYFKKADLEKLHKWMLNQMKKRTIRLDKVYYCSHKSEDNCSCRKPATGMLEKAMREFNISLSKSWVVGDRETDVRTGKEANTKTIKIGPKIPQKNKIQPDFYAKNLSEAINIIIKASKNNAKK